MVDSDFASLVRAHQNLTRIKVEADRQRHSAATDSKELWGFAVLRERADRAQSAIFDVCLAGAYEQESPAAKLAVDAIVKGAE